MLKAVRPFEIIDVDSGYGMSVIPDLAMLGDYEAPGMVLFLERALAEAVDPAHSRDNLRTAEDL